MSALDHLANPFTHLAVPDMGLHDMPCIPEASMVWFGVHLGLNRDAQSGKSYPQDVEKKASKTLTAEFMAPVARSRGVTMQLNPSESHAGVIGRGMPRYSKIDVWLFGTLLSVLLGLVYGTLRLVSMHMFIVVESVALVSVMKPWLLPPDAGGSVA
eukprot:4248574-Amphidinium_carterae.1